MKKVSTPVKIFVTISLIIVIYLVYTKYKAKKETTTVADETPVTPSLPNSNVGTTAVNNDTILKKGSKNDRVLWLQGYYNKYVAPIDHKDKIEYDGIFGSETEKAVKHVMGTTSTTWTKFKSRVDYNYK